MIEQTQKPTEKKPVKASLDIKQIAENVRASKKWLKKGPYQADDARWKQWERNKQYLMCIWPDSGPKDVNVNTIRANYQTVRPTLYFKNPKVTGVPTKPSFTRDDVGNKMIDPKTGHPIMADNYVAAKIASIKINYELKEMNFKNLMRKVTGDVLCPYGIGWAKIGFSTLTVGGHDNDRDTKYTYWIQRCDPRLVYPDWMATEIDNARYISEDIIMTRQEAEDYDFKIPPEYIASLPDFLKNRSEAAKREKQNSDIVIVNEYTDIKNGMVYWSLISDEKGDFAVQAKAPVEYPYPFEGSPYVPLVLNDDNDDIVGLSDVEPVEDQVLALNRLRTKQTKHVEWFGTRITYKDGSIEPSEIDKTKVTDHGVYLKRSTSSTSDDVNYEAPPSMGQDNYAMVNEHKEDIRTTLGITEFQQGSSGAASTKATIGNIVQNSSIARIEEKRDIIHDFVISCVRKLFACIQEFSTEEEYLNLKEEVMDEDFVGVIKKDFGFNPKIPFLKMSKKDIQGEFNFEFNVEDMVVQSKDVQAQQFTNFLNVIFANPVLGQKFVEEFDIAKTLKKGAELFGIDLGELRKGGPQMLSPEQENQMFLNGMEVPEPHLKDHDDEHIMSHDRVLKQLESQLQQGTAQVQQLMMHQQQMTEMAQQVSAAGQEQGMLPSAAPQVPPDLQQQIDESTTSLEPIQNIVRKIKIHNQWHDMNRQKKEMDGMPGGGAGQMPQGQPGASAQTQMQAQAGAVQ